MFFINISEKFIASGAIDIAYFIGIDFWPYLFS